MLYERKNSAYWRNEIATSSGDSKKLVSALWNVFHAVLGETRTDDTDPHTADEFAVFFRDKIDSVRASTVSTPLYKVPFRTTPTLEQFTPVTVEEVDKMIGSVPCKTYQLVVGEGDARADFAILVAVVQQVVDLRLFPVRFQECGGTSTA